MNNHPYHIVNKRPWPIIISFCLLIIAVGAIKIFHNSNYNFLLYSIFILILIFYQWWRDIIRESTLQGMHTIKVQKRLKLGIIFFIISEILFFISFFWAFFHRSLSPSIEIGINWPPVGIKSFNPIRIPILNTIILLSSGVSLTWAHRSIIINNLTKRIKRIIITVILGLYFSILQLLEYIEAPFCISDSIYGSVFFISTGFHGLHVIIGTMFIVITITRLIKLHYSKKHHVGFECCAWYWHFVDVVWLFLYLTIYWWTYYLFSINVHLASN